MKGLVQLEHIARRIYLIRGHRVMLDSDLAQLYGVSTKVLNQAVKRNLARFPDDFMFRLTADEAAVLRSQTVTLEPGRGKHRKYLPHVFTEHGSVMLAAVLHSPVAVEASIRIARAFVKLRELLATHRELAVRLDVIERRLAKQDSTLGRHTEELRAVFEAIRQLMEPKPKRAPRRLRVTGFRHRPE